MSEPIGAELAIWFFGFLVGATIGILFGYHVGARDGRLAGKL